MGAGCDRVLRLQMGAAQVLKEFYLELRRKAVESVDSAPITTRQLESLVRLAEARARADLRQVRCMLSVFGTAQ